MAHPFWHTSAAALSVALAARAMALEPGDIAVIFNTNSPSSLQIARYYMSARKIPANHLIPVTCDVGENISEGDYNTKLVPQVLRGLSTQKLLPDEKKGIAGVKCLVTTYDVPLRVLAHEPTAAERNEIAGLEKDLDATIVELDAQVAAYNAIVPGAGAPASAPATAPATTAAKPTWQTEVAKINAAASAAGQRIEKLSEPARSEALAPFIRLQEKVAGITGVLNTLHVSDDAPGADAGRKQLADLSSQLLDLQGQFQALAKQLDMPRIRREIVDVRQKAEGIVGRARMLEELIAYLRPEDTASCVDNELALVLADQKYPRGRWVDNPKNIENWPQVQRLPAERVPAVLMVARIDGSTVAKVQEMIDTTLAVEEKGLEGKLYLDARGLHGTDAYALFDADLRRTADWIKEHATIDVVLDDKPELLRAADCPEAALYCGWYSLNSYQDSCQWVKGAVGYHVASYEMPSLHNPKENGWVVQLLNRGFCGTLGATDEPYLTAFPKPSLFFPLLLSGEFTQGEVWELTAPMVSWRIGFAGDPLYNPFKSKPRVKTADLLQHSVLRNAYAVLGRESRK